jgi:protein-disulfide isomerase
MTQTLSYLHEERGQKTEPALSPASLQNQKILQEANINNIFTSHKLGRIVALAASLRSAVFFLLFTLLITSPAHAFLDELFGEPKKGAAALGQKPSDIILGDPDAPVIIVEYASMSCGHCAHFHTNVLPEIKKNYIDAGKVKFIFRHFPLNEPALKAAQLTYCGGKKRFNTFTKVLFDTQSKWAFDSNYLDSLSTIARVGGISKDQFDACMTNPDLERNLLLQRQEAADQIGVSATPTFFINGNKLEGSWTIERFSAELDKALSGK